LDPIVVFLAFSLILAAGAAAYLWLRPPVQPAAIIHAAAPVAPPATLADFVARLDRLEAAFPAWKVAIDGVLDEVDDVLDRVRKRKARIDGARAHGAEDAPGDAQLELVGPGGDRDAVKRAVRERMRSQGR
jgi:hypothetical protein